MGFRKDFIWGAATASYQVEGGVYEDGKGLSIWDTFSRYSGITYKGHTGDVACDHYHRFRDDVKMMAALGIRNYRFSISWPRILPEGIGPVNEKGIAFYNALIDELLAHGIRPFVTLFHWDYPQALQMRGGWTNPESPEWFRYYAEVCAKAFGDRVKDWITLNEPQVFLGIGYRLGGMAPGLRLHDADLVPAAHHILQAQGLAVQMFRQYIDHVRVGYAPCGDPAIPFSDRAEDIEAARRAYFATREKEWVFSVGVWSDPILLGCYPQDFLSAYGKLLPASWEKDLRDTIAQPLDFYAQNIYKGVYYKAADNAKGYETVDYGTGNPETANDWAVTPDALYWGPRFLCERYKTPLIITENGMSGHDWPALDGGVHDTSREDFLHRYLLALRRAADDGVDVRGYFVWSLMDNYEWSSGYKERFGIVYVDYDTLERTPKDSARWYQHVMESNGENL